MTVIAIVAYDQRRGIGKNGFMPWHFPTELRWLAKTTTATTGTGRVNALLMGRRTWESLPVSRRPLRGRLNIVVSRSGLARPEDGALVFSSLFKAVSFVSKCDWIDITYVFGGQEIYAESLELNLVDYVLATEINALYDADTFFPPLGAHFSRVASKPLNIEGIPVTRKLYTSKDNGEKDHEWAARLL